MSSVRDNIEIRSEEVQEILGTPPSWLVRYGTTLALFTIVVIGWMAYFVKYPDTVTAEISVTSVDRPRTLVADRPAFISSILVENEDTVKAGQTLITFQSKAKFEDIHILEDAILNVKDINIQDLVKFDPPKDLILGEIQDALYDFLEKKEAYELGASGKLENLSISQLNQEIRIARSGIEYEKKQKETMEKELAIANEKYIREQNLYQSKRNDLDRVRQAQEEALRIKRLLQGTEANIKNKEFEIEAIRRQINGYKEGSKQSKSSLANQLKESFITLRNRVDEWKKQYLVIAPVKGLAVIPMDISDKHYIEKDKDLVVIVPAGNSGIVGRMDLNIQGSGKVKAGQKVIVKFASYPFQEFGAVEGEVSRKGKIPTDKKKIEIEVIFPQGLSTTTGKTIEASQVMLGKAQIVTEEKRFIEWVFERVRW
ncbi:MAG: hypothetical protein R2828_31310 [Saprospiraceae bacterium]